MNVEKTYGKYIAVNGVKTENADFTYTVAQEPTSVTIGGSPIEYNYNEGVVTIPAVKELAPSTTFYSLVIANKDYLFWCYRLQGCRK